MTERVIADSPSDGWSIGLVLSDNLPASQPPPTGSTLTGVHVVGPITFASITLAVTVNGKSAQFQAVKGSDRTFPVTPPMAIETGLGIRGTGWRVAGITDSLTVLDPNGNVLASTSA